MPILQLRSQLALQTRNERQVENEINREPVRAGDRIQVNDFQAEYRNAIHRPVDPSRKYNCHGLSFACRRTWIEQAKEVAKIIQDDEYQTVPIIDDVLPGDIAVYYRDGDAEHSGIVVRMDEISKHGFGKIRIPVILSKWGACHEVVHRVADCPYNAANVSYYRIRT